MQLTMAGIVLSRPLFDIQMPRCVYTGPLILLSPLWQMPLWHQVAYATAIPSGIISTCICSSLYLVFFYLKIT